MTDKSTGSETPLSRRRILLMTAVAAAGGATSATYLRRSTTPALALDGTEDEWTVDNISITAENGTIGDISLDTNAMAVVVQWDDFPDGEYPLDIRFYVRLAEQGTNTGSDEWQLVAESSDPSHAIATTSGEMEVTNSGDHQFGPDIHGASIIDSNAPIVRDDFNVRSEDNGERTTTVELMLEVEVADLGLSAQYVDSFDVTVYEDSTEPTIRAGGYATLNIEE